VVAENKIDLNFHYFSEYDSQSQSKFIFCVVINKECDIKASGIADLQKIISNEYNHSSSGVSTTLKHRLVYNILTKMSEMEENDENDLLIDEEKQEKSPFIQLSFVREKILEEFKIGIVKVLKSMKKGKSLKEEITKMLQRENLSDFIEANNQLGKILLDLHKLGVIIYFDHYLLKETIICKKFFFLLFYQFFIKIFFFS
jgi:uncharacterized protein with von Willebrand factor type A (vWA) domain